MNVLNLPSLFFGIYLIVPLLLGCFLLFGVFSHRDSMTKAQRLAGVLLIIDALYLLVRTILADQGWLHNPEFRRNFFILDSTIISLFLLVPYTVIHERYPAWWTYLLTLAPIVLIPIVALTGKEALASWSHLLPIGAAVFVLVLSIKSARRVDEQLLDEYANPEYRNKSWIISLCIAFLVVSIASLLRYFFHGHIWYNTIVSLMWSGLIIGIYAMLIIKKSTHPVEVEEKRPTIQLKEKTREYNNEAIGKALTQKCIVEQLYLRGDLSADILARECNTNRTYLATYLRVELHKNFYEYINQLRLQQVDLLMEDPSLSQEVIAQKCGFNSARTMRRAYQKLNGRELSR